MVGRRKRQIFGGNMSGNSIYLGFDFSTQQIKCVAIDEELNFICEKAVRFDTDLPEFKTQGGVHVHDDRVTVTVPTALWVKALDILLFRLQNGLFDFSNVMGISGCGQQHGSVYWKKGSKLKLNKLKPLASLHDQLKDGFSVPESPIWMDASTMTQCQKLEESVGGPLKLAEITGSRAFVRMTGEQIMKISQNDPETYANTERISLVSSFVPSILIGDYAPIDFSDGSGMNLLDINTKTWSKQCLDACGENLGEKLGEPVPSPTVVGNIHSYFCDKYGFPDECKIVAFTGDNPSSLAGLSPRVGDVIFSLGTSDCIFLWVPDWRPILIGDAYINPVHQEEFYNFVGFKNGSLEREGIKDRCAGSWEKFEDMVKSTPMGNNGNFGLFFGQVEVQPFVKGTFRFNEKNEKVDAFPPDVEVRAVLEGQMIARRVYSELRGMKITQQTRLLATGGASNNKAIQQVMADVFNAPVYTTQIADSAALGGCYRAIQACTGKQFEDVVKNHPEPVCVAKPTLGCVEIYDKMCERYRIIEKIITEK
ncbi:xylulose kinase-like isoform X2 [Mytilus galloprovincialis]|uniref:xylulose kinase-like isoform X2 n=1 Tax=Mytilus galloprovincialis TaxID=29158 RepID=UPI003F7C9A47